MPKNIEQTIKKYRKSLYCQNIKDIRKGSPVCPEKNKSPVKFIILLKFPVISIWVGKGPMCVIETKMDLIIKNKAMLFKTKGIRLGCKIDKIMTGIQTINIP